MNCEKVISVVSQFTQICIFNIDDTGVIKDVLINSKEVFVPKEKNIYKYFSKENRERVKELIDSGLDGKKRYFRLVGKYTNSGSLDVEVKSLQGDLYVAFEFTQSNKERELKYEEIIRTLSVQAKIDPMTKLLNRYAYWERVKGMLNCGDPDRRLGILVIDVDHLKQINDGKGHKEGDKALKQISELISRSIRNRDIAVRYGGDEFVIVVEELSGSRSTAHGLGNRIIKMMNEKARKMITTVSIGVHVVKVGDFEKNLSDEDRLRKQWDVALNIADHMAYKAKENGRNQVVFSG